jgi:ABC-type multidrug transport system ATPase subunit
VVALLGPNGAGKTTLLRLLAGTLRMQQGRFRDVAGQGHPRGVGYLPQAASWPGHFRVREFIDYLAWTRGVSAPDRRWGVEASLRAVGLEQAGQTRLRSLSGGQHRRAMLAQALVGDPGVLLLDEPTNGFDPVQRVAFRDLVASLAADRCVVISTHLVEDVEAIASWVTIINSGRIAFDGTKESLLAQPSGDGRSDLESHFLRLVR